MEQMLEEKKMSPEDTKKPTRNHHPMKWIAIFLSWILALYLALLILNNKEIDPSKPESSRPSIQKPLGACKSPECITLAHQLHNWQDISVDPCQNFYQAVCGKYNEHTTQEGTRFHEKWAIIDQIVGGYLAKNQPTTSKSEKAMLMYLQTCQESKSSNKTELREAVIRETLETIKKIGPWPMAEPHWNESDFDLNEMLSNMASLGIENFGFFELKGVDSNLNISFDTTIENIDEKSTIVHRIGDQILNQIFASAGAQSNQATFVNGSKEWEKFFQILSGIQKTNKNATYEGTIGFSELQSKVPSVDFERIIKSFLSPKRSEKVWNGLVGKIVARKNDQMISGELETILKTTPKRTLANFLIINFIINKAYDATVERLILKSETSCLKQSVQVFPLASLRVLARNNFDKENLEVASGIVEEFRKSFIEMIQESKWMHEETKKGAIRKAEMMKKTMGYPKEFEIPGSLDSFFDSLNLSSNDSYHVLMRKIRKFNFELNLNYIASEFPIPTEAFKHFFGVSAFYGSDENRLVLPVPFLSSPFFDLTYPMHVNIASIGRSIGHEMGHGFDVYNRKLDKNGKMNDWWTPEDSIEYETRVQCLVDQLNNYDDPTFGRNLNGSMTINEVVPDIFGLTTSWKTYKRLHSSKEQHIIGFEDYNTDKLFFRLTALNWCRGRDETSLSEQLTKVHPTSSFRVNGVFSNIKEFAEAYNCPIGSPMNPEKKCELF